MSDSIWGQTNSYNHNTERAEALRQEYLASILKEFDDWAKFPEVLGKSITELSDRLKPQLPAELPVGVMLIIGDKWGGDAGKDELWSDKAIQVRYRFAIRSKIGKESEKSAAKYSTEWKSPEGKCLPEIYGLPTKGDYLTYIQDICVYRQFRKLLADGKYKEGKERRVAIIPRVEGQEGFAGQWVDKKSASFDKEEFSK